MQVGTVFIYRSLFRDAERDEDGTLRIWIGPQLLCLESLAPPSRASNPIPCPNRVARLQSNEAISATGTTIIVVQTSALAVIFRSSP